MMQQTTGRLTPTTNPGYNDQSPSGFGGTYQSRLSAHDMALSTPVSGIRPQDSPSVIVTGNDPQQQQQFHNQQQQRYNMQPQQQQQGGTIGPGGDMRGRAAGKESFASALKKRLSRAGPGKKRSQSADRAQQLQHQQHVVYDNSGSYLRPPGASSQMNTAGNSMQGYRTTDNIDDRQGRSNSFTSSLRRMFKPSSRKDVNLSGRGGSLNRNLPQPPPPQQQLGYGGGGGGYDRSLRQGTPVPPPGERGSSQGPELRSMTPTRDPYGRTTPTSSRHQQQQSASLSPY
jgi:hypothetical protein